MQTPMERFTTILTGQYEHLYEAEPEEYSMAASRYTPQALAEKMTRGLTNGSAGKDGEGIKRTCKVLGIKHTYKAIKAFLENDNASVQD